MSVSPSLVLNDTTAAVVAAPTDAPIVGTPARKLASAQGYCWEAIEQTVAVTAHAESFTAVDSQGDVLAHHLAQLLARMASMARREGAPQTEAMCREAVATFARITEMDSAEDWHVGQMAARAGHATVSERQASRTIGAVLGQRDAVCGRERAAEGGIEFDPCGQPAGHGLDGSVCVFMARIGSGSAPSRRGVRSQQQGRAMGRVIDMAPVRSVFFEIALMDGLSPTEMDGRVFVPALHQHRPDAPARVEISAWGDVDALLADARHCQFADCSGRETVRRIDADREAELRDMHVRLQAGL